METRSMAQFGKDVSLLGFGCMRLPFVDEETQEIDFAAAQAMVDHALANGVNYFDTAFMYHRGNSEKFLGKALAKHSRDSFFLADKLPIWNVKTPEDVDSLFAKQLDRCNVSFFDFYLAHSLNKKYYKIFQQHGVYEKLRKMKEDGKITHLGFSFHDNAEMLERILIDYSWDFVQIQLNYIDWETCDAKSLYALLEKYKLPVVIMEPVRGGALATLTDNALGILKKANSEASVASWAIRYAASLPNVMTVLSGMSSMAQLEDNIKTMTPFRPLSEEEYAVIGQAAMAYMGAGSIPCTGCRYCLPCPSGVDIPRVFAMYNHYKANNNKIYFMNNYQSLRESEQAGNCTSCSACVERCPQAIAIPEFMAEVAEVVAQK